MPPRATIREGPLAELFGATEGGQVKRRSDLRQERGAVSLALMTPNAIAIASVGLIAVTALVISVWQLAEPHARQSGGAVPVARVTVTTSAETRPAQAPAAAPSQAEKRTGTPAKLVLTAARGDCWLEARTGSARGDLLFAGTLEQGRKLRFVKPRLWVAFGAGGNLDVTLNGWPVEDFPTGTTAVTVTAEGVIGPASA